MALNGITGDVALDRSEITLFIENDHISWIRGVEEIAACQKVEEDRP